MTSPRSVLSLTTAFGGTRIPDGRSTVTLYADGVVIAHSWTLGSSTLNHSFRGTIARSDRSAPRDRWHLRREGDGGLMDTYRTRREAVEGAQRLVQTDAFRALNAMEALASRVVIVHPECPACTC